MKIYKHKGAKILEDSDTSSEFCKKINDLSDAMNSNTPKTGLKPGSNEWKVMYCTVSLNLTLNLICDAETITFFHRQLKIFLYISRKLGTLLRTLKI